MKISGCLRLLGWMVACACVIGPASANIFGTVYTPPAPSAVPGSAAARLGATINLGFFPIAEVNTSVRNFNIKQTGMIVSAERDMPIGQAGRSYGIGGWYFHDYSSASDYYEVNGQYYVSPQWGVQAGVQGSTAVTGHPFNVNLLYKYVSRPTGKDGQRPWAVQLGLGSFIDPTGGSTTAGTNLFIGASRSLGKRLSANATYYYVKDRGADYNRGAIGVGYQLQ